jgi:hypothetical protein
MILLAAAALAAAPAQARRLALVIGNDSYQHADPLTNARADARAVAAALRDTDFEVTLKLDLPLQGMKEATRNFKNQVRGGDEVIFYYSGHGVQIDGNNFMIPVDTAGESADQIKDDSIPLQRVLDDMQDQKAKFTLAIIDACRDNPFRSNGRAIRTRGLAPVTAADGQAVLYSAGTGQEALDNLGSGDANPNGVFTRVLIREMKRPGASFDQVIHDVRNQVVELAKSVGHDQTPGYYSQFTGDFYFIPPGPGQMGGGSVQAGRLQTEGERERSFWDRIRDSSDAADFMDYGRNFPEGPHAAEAALMVRKLQRAAAAAPGGSRGPATSARTVEPVWVPYEDPAEHAFSMKVPKGWTVAGGTYRFGTVDAPRMMVDLVSPDGSLRLRIGDAGVPPYVVASTALRLQGMREGSRSTPNGSQAIVANYRNGWTYADLYGQARFAPYCRNLELKQLRELPTVGGVGGESHQTAGGAVFRCESNAGLGNLMGFVFAETQLTNSQANDVWTVGPLYSMLAPEALGAAALRILLHVADTHVMNEKWALTLLAGQGIDGAKADQMYQSAVSEESSRHRRLSAELERQAEALAQAVDGQTLTTNTLDSTRREIWDGSSPTTIVSPVRAVASPLAYRQ